jgi:hypothetical protein
MIEAGGPSTGPFRDRDIGCARPTGVVMVSLPEAPRNGESAQSEGRAKRTSEKRGQGQYKGRSPKAPPEVLEELQVLL